MALLIPLHPAVILSNLLLLLMASTSLLLISSLIGSLVDLVSGDFTGAGVGAQLLLYSLLLTTTLYLSYRRVSTERPITYLEAVVTVALTWVLAPLLVTPAFLLTGLDLLSAYFEAVSGFTGTGLTVLSHIIEELPTTLKLLRGLLQWYGEAGIALCAIALLARPGSPTAALYFAEGRLERIKITVIETARTIFRIYVTYTILNAVLLFLAGMTPLDAVVHAMTTVATGGFSNWSNSLEHYVKVLGHYRYMVEVVTCIFMILGALNFADHAKLFRGDVRGFFSPETRGFLILTGIMSLAVVLSYHYADGLSLSRAVEVGVFHAVSALTTTGFQVSGLCEVSDVTKFLLTLSMIIGGCTCSTAGGIKIYRLIVLLKYVKYLVKTSVYPSHVIIRVSVGGKVVTEDIASRVALFTFIYLSTLGISTVTLTALGYSVTDALFESASALGCAGLSVGITSVDLHPLGKVILIVDMLMGRLEFYPLLITFYAVALRLRR